MNKYFLILFIFLSLLTINCVYADNGEPMDVFGEWTVFRTVQDNKTLCYIMNIPQSKQSDYERRGEPFFMVIKEAGAKSAEINTSVGFIISDYVGSIELDINNNRFPLLNAKDKAWAYNVNDDANIIKSLMKNALFTIYSVSENGRYAMDIYSLLGFKEAYEAMDNMCK